LHRPDVLDILEALLHVLLAEVGLLAPFLPDCEAGQLGPDFRDVEGELVGAGVVGPGEFGGVAGEAVADA
jgi:hypothetical protein